jgi:hypothetical protein
MEVCVRCGPKNVSCTFQTSVPVLVVGVILLALLVGVLHIILGTS